MSKTRSTDAANAWRAMLVTFTSVHNQLADELHEECGLPMEHYEILLMLFEAGPEGLRPSEIADRRRLSRSGVTRLIDRLEGEKLVERRACDDDRRGSVVGLSDAGRAVFTRAGRVHLAGIEHYVGGSLTTQEMAELEGLLKKVSLEPLSNGGSDD